MTPGDPLIRPDWLVQHAGDVAQRVIEHVELTGIAIGFGLLIAFALSFWSLRQPRVYAPIIWVTGVLYTIPSLALFALLIPLTGLSLLTAEIGLVSYTLLILIRGIVDGVRSVPSDVYEAALGMGYGRGQLLREVELPLATVVIVGAVRVATITTIGLTTVTALIGEGGLGYLIVVQGIQGFFATPLIVGAVLSIALAVAADGALLLLQHRLTPWAQ